MLHKNAVVYQIHHGAFRALVKRHEPVCILVIAYLYKYIDPAYVKRVADEYGVTLFLYDTDSCNLYSDRKEFDLFLSDEAPIYDEIFSFSKVMTEFFIKTRQLHASYLPYGAEETERKELLEKNTDVLFVGTGDLRRIFLLERIKAYVTVYGVRWAKYENMMTAELFQRVIDKKIWGKDLHQTLAESKIVLNINNINFYGIETGVNLRIFEALSAGCFLLTEHSDEIAELFVVGKEIETFHSASDLLDKVIFYLHNDEKRREIAEAGYQKFLRNYTWQHQVEVMKNRIQCYEKD